METIILKLHEHWTYIPDVINLLGHEWPMSVEYREMRLRKSNSNLPTNLILLITNPVHKKCDNCIDAKCYERPEVIGHALLRRTGANAVNADAFNESVTSVAMVESVVIVPHYRKHGFGSILMKGVEEFARSLGIRKIDLITNDQQTFYEKLGYETNVSHDPIPIPYQHSEVVLGIAPPPPPPPPVKEKSNVTFMFKEL